MENVQYYTSYLERLAGMLARLKRHNRYFILTEIVFFASSIAALVAYTATDWGWPCLLAAAVCLLFYVGTRFLDGRNATRIDENERLQRVFRYELEALKGDYSHFDNGQQYVDYHHPFTFDLDIFGPQSLFARMNRTVTTGGSRLLARYLSFGKMCHQPDEIQYFSRQYDFMDSFQAYGQAGLTDTEAILSVREALRSSSLPAWIGSRWARVVAWAMVGMLPLIILLAVWGIVDSTFPVFYGVMQFFLVYLTCNATARSIGRQTDRLHQETEGFVRLLNLCVARNEWPETMKGEHEQLKQAAESARMLEEIISKLDRRGNILGLILIDTFLLNDYFLIREYQRWRGRFLENIEQWVAVLSHVDALVSLGRYVFNHPATTIAEVIDGEAVVYEAEDLYHPFLGPQAVKNDFKISDGSYTIVTGANMAGKSTFLRTLGINYVLARNGIPVCARRMKVSRFNLFSSMRTTDDLPEGISYFNAELLRLEQLIHFCKATEGPRESNRQYGRTLIILDEILKGTNSLDKLNGSRLFLEAISRLPVTGVIATHDLELSKMADEQPQRFRNYCFEIELGTKVTYSYRITPGVARNQNATYLLKNVLKAIG